MINFVKNFNTEKANLGFFVSEDSNFSNLDRIDLNLKKTISQFFNNHKKASEGKKIFSLDLSIKQKIFLILVKKNLKTFEINQLGADFKNIISNEKKITEVSFYADLNFLKNKELEKNVINEFAYGFELKSYSFEKYKSKKKTNLQKIIFASKYSEQLEKEYVYLNSVKNGVYLTRDLISEPPNILYPKKYVEEIKKLSSLGLKIKIYDEKEMKKLGMNALLGVGQGSSRESFLVTLHWDGGKKNDKPLAFVGKGVCFDTGGISLKPARFMEEMKYDMGGSAVVVGLMKSVALRKAKVNAVGVVGLVENMPDGNAQRPGDIVKSYSGKTIEILNTDAEGRLVLADALSFTEDKFKPKFIIDLATLTGAIIISLGEEFAGLFSNDDKLSRNLFDVGEEINEKVWRLPLHKNYDKLINSSYADVQNINYAGGAGSITAAQFLKRFINNTPWVHLDIAGMAFSKKAANLNSGGATGYGVRLLSDFIKRFYE